MLRLWHYSPRLLDHYSVSDKMGVDERRFYKSMIKLVETEFLNHLKERGLCDSRLKRAVGSQAVRERTDYIKYIFSILIIFVFNFLYMGSSTHTAYAKYGA